MDLPLKGITVIEFSQYLSGPVAGLRLADFGARVIKIERPGAGDACRKLAIKDLWVDDSSLLFHTINRNKESYVADLKRSEDVQMVKQLIASSDVVTHNFRPGVMESLGLNYDVIKAFHPAVIYTAISGYGNTGPWQHKPGQDLLVQSMSGLSYATGNQQDAPVPFGLAIGDYLCGSQAVQAILAALIRRYKTGKGALLELNMMESLIDFQFEFFTTYFQHGRQHQRAAVNNGHALLSAPYGIYQTANGYIALAMMPLSKLNAAISCDAIRVFGDDESFVKRDEIKTVLKEYLLTATTEHWLEKMRVHDLWAMPVLNWQELRKATSYQSLKMEQQVQAGESKITTTRCPVSINKQHFLSSRSAPKLGEHTEQIKKELESGSI